MIYFAEIEVAPEFVAMSAVDAVPFVERTLRDRLRERYGDEIAERGRVVWRARIEVYDPTERNDR